MVRTETIAISFDRDTHPRVFWSREMDTVDNNKAAAAETSGTKIAIPNMTLEVIDRAIQVRGAANSSIPWPTCTRAFARFASPTSPTRCTR